MRSENEGIFFIFFLTSSFRRLSFHHTKTPKMDTTNLTQKIIAAVIALQTNGYVVLNNVYALHEHEMTAGTTIQVVKKKRYAAMVEAAKQDALSIGAKAKKGDNGVESGHLIGVMHDTKTIAVIVITSSVSKVDLASICGDLKLVPHHHTENEKKEASEPLVLEQ